MSIWKRGEYPKYAAHLRDVERAYSIPENLLARLMNYDAQVIAGTDRSAAGALGIAALTPDIPPRYGFSADDRRAPNAAIIIAARHLSSLRREFGTWERAVLAYRWNPAFVARLYDHAPSETPPVIPRMIQDDVRRIAADVKLHAHA